MYFPGKIISKGYRRLKQVPVLITHGSHIENETNLVLNLESSHFVKVWAGCSRFFQSTYEKPAVTMILQYLDSIWTYDSILERVCKLSLQILCLLHTLTH